MLQRLHERMQGIVMTVIIVAICLAFALWGIQYYLRSYGAENSVAKVNGVKITRRQLQAALQRAREQLIRKEGSKFIFDDNSQKELNKQVLKGLVNGQAFYQEATKEGFTVGEQEVDAYLTQIPMFQENGRFSQSKFIELLGRMLFSEQEYIMLLQQDILAHQLQFGLAKSSFILPDELNRIISLMKQQRDISYVTVPVANFLPKIKISKEDIAGYYAKNKQSFTVPEKVSVKYIELSADKLKLKSPVTLQQMRQYYDDHIDMYTQPKKWQISYVFVPLLQTATGSSVKAANKKVVALAKKGSFGKSNWVAAGQAGKSFLDVLQKMKPGQVSEPFRAPNGFYVLKLLQSKPSKILPFDKVKKNVAKAASSDLLAKMFDAARDKLDTVTFNYSDDLKTASKELGLPIQTTSLFTRKGGKAGVAAVPQVIKEAFNDEVLKQKLNSRPIDITPEKVVVIRINKYQPEIAKPLKDVSAVIEKTLKSQNAAKEAKSFGMNLINTIKQGRPIVGVLSSNKLQLKKAAKLGRDSKTVAAQVVAKAFSLPLVNTNKVSAGGVALENGDFAVVQVNRVYPGNIANLSKKQLNSFKRDIMLGLGAQTFTIFSNKLIKNAKIEIFSK